MTLQGHAAVRPAAACRRPPGGYPPWWVKHQGGIDGFVGSSEAARAGNGPARNIAANGPKHRGRPFIEKLPVRGSAAIVTAWLPGVLIVIALLIITSWRRRRRRNRLERAEEIGASAVGTITVNVVRTPQPAAFDWVDKNRPQRLITPPAADSPTTADDSGWQYVAPRDGFDGGAILASDLHVAADIRYADGAGIVTQRRITIQHVLTFGGINRSYEHPGYVQAWCHKAKAARTFNIHRIQELVDPETGEVAQQPVKWIERACGIRTPLAPFRQVTLEPLPPPVILTWQRALNDVERYELAIDDFQTVDNWPVVIAGHGHRLPGSKRRAAKGNYRFDLCPLSESPARPLTIRWATEEEAADQANVVGWLRRLVDGAEVAAIPKLAVQVLPQAKTDGA